MTKVRFWLRMYVIDWWWEWGQGTRYRVRFGPIPSLAFTFWRTSGAPYGLRKHLRGTDES